MSHIFLDKKQQAQMFYKFVHASLVLPSGGIGTEFWNSDKDFDFNLFSASARHLQLYCVSAVFPTMIFADVNASAQRKFCNEHNESLLEDFLGCSPCNQQTISILTRIDSLFCTLIIISLLSQLCLQYFVVLFSHTCVVQQNKLNTIQLCNCS